MALTAALLFPATAHNFPVPPPGPPACAREDEGIVAGLSTRNYRRAVETVLDGYGMAKSSVSREFVQASAAQLKKLCERKLDGLDLVAILIDGIHLG